MRILQIILLIFPCITFSQESMVIKHLANAINSVGAELNFFQDEKNHAFFTAIRDDNNNYISSIYSSNLQLDQWSKGDYFSSFNSDYMQSGNLFITKDKTAYFTFCKGENCAIYRSKLKKQKWTNPKKLDERINKIGSTSTQPTIAIIQGKQLLYFVSDREGGIGGLDIWLSAIDDNGNFGNPINLGSKINTNANEITPFYNQEKGALFFSSDREKGMGGYDIYTSKGSLALWESPELLPQPLNSTFDEMYLNFHQEDRGHFSSNRSPAIFEDEESCCNDIFSFEFSQHEKDSLKIINKINDFLPLSLYFHNDEPDCCTMKTTTNLTYKESYISYFYLKEEYIKQNNSPEKIQRFFDDRLKENFNKLDQLLLKIRSALAQGQKIELQIKGFASPLFKAKYNINLSKRRIVSLLNYMEEFQNGSITQYLKNEQLVIYELPIGEAQSSKKVSDNPRNKKLSVYSLEAALARKIEIVRVKLKQ